jgi:hypothetical protein
MLLIGDPDTLAEEASRFKEVGVEGFTVTIPDVHDLETVELVGKAIGPVFAGSASAAVS